MELWQKEQKCWMHIPERVQHPFWYFSLMETQPQVTIKHTNTHHQYPQSPSVVNDLIVTGLTAVLFCQQTAKSIMFIYFVLSGPLLPNEFIPGDPKWCWLHQKEELEWVVWKLTNEFRLIQKLHTKAWRKSANHQLMWLIKSITDFTWFLPDLKKGSNCLSF